MPARMIDLVHVTLVAQDEAFGQWLAAELARQGLELRTARTLGESAAASAILLEQPYDGQSLREAVRAAAQPVAVLDPAHDEIAEAAFRQAGAVVAGTSEALADALVALTKAPGMQASEGSAATAHERADAKRAHDP